MIPKSINIEKYAKEYWKNNAYPEGPKLFWESRVEAILYTLTDEEENYDEQYIYNLVNIMISAYQKFVPKVLADNILNMEDLFFEIEGEDEESYLDYLNSFSSLNDLSLKMDFNTFKNKHLYNFISF